MSEYKHLPESELDIMLAVWAEDGTTTAPRIMERLKRPLTASALHSYLRRLAERGYLSCEKRSNRTNSYRALISREEYERKEGRSVLNKLYEGSLKRFAASLYDGGALSEEDVAELRDFLDKL